MVKIKTTKPVVIAVDQGNFNIKACGPSGPIEPFPTGVNMHGVVPPPMTPGSIKYGDKYYSITTERMQSRRNKTMDEDYLVLTLAAIARTLMAAYPGYEDYTSEVMLALGLPVEHLSLRVDGVLLREKYRTFFSNNGAEINFMCDGLLFHIKVPQVMVFAQTISAAISDGPIYSAMRKSSRAYIIDIGGGTANVISIIEGKPQNPGITLEEMGVLELFKYAHRAVMADCGRSIDDYMLDVIMRGKKKVSAEMMQAIERAQLEFCKKLITELEARKVDFYMGYICLVGGGSVLLQMALSKAIEEKGNTEMAVIQDVSANARGYYAQAKSHLAKKNIEIVADGPAKA